MGVLQMSDARWFEVLFAWDDGAICSVRLAAPSAPLAFSSATEDDEYLAQCEKRGSWERLMVQGIPSPNSKPLENDRG